MFKCAFMHENWTCYLVAHFLEIWTTSSYKIEVKFYSDSCNIVVKKNIEFLECLIYAVDHQKWPSSVDFDIITLGKMLTEK